MRFDILFEIRRINLFLVFETPVTRHTGRTDQNNRVYVGSRNCSDPTKVGKCCSRKSEHMIDTGVAITS